jgi:hypothetical protein
MDNFELVYGLILLLMAHKHRCVSNQDPQDSGPSVVLLSSDWLKVLREELSLLFLSVREMEHCGSN